MDYIHNVISKGNEKSNIIFLMTEGLNTSVLSGDCQYFVMRNKYSGETKDELTGWFEGNDQFMKYCCENITAYTLLKNILFYQDKNKLFD